MPWHDATQRAHALRYWQPILIPGICQTAAYAYETYRAVGRSPEQAEEAAAARLARQAVLSREDGPTVVIVLDA